MKIHIPITMVYLTMSQVDAQAKGPWPQKLDIMEQVPKGQIIDIRPFIAVISGNGFNQPDDIVTAQFCKDEVDQGITRGLDNHLPMNTINNPFVPGNGFVKIVGGLINSCLSEKTKGAVVLVISSKPMTPVLQ